jgi:hypothetical protein
MLGVMVVTGTTGYALEEPQGFIDVYTIETKNAEHRYVLDTMRGASRSGARMIMNNDRLVATMIQMGRYELARYMRESAEDQALQLQEDWRQQAQQELKRWGYQV